MSLRGSQETVNLVSLLSLITDSGHSGTLRLRLAERMVSLHFHDGLIYLLNSVNAQGPEKIVAPLVREGKLGEDDLIRVLTIQKQMGVTESLGNLLISQGLVSREDVDAVLRDQLEEEICDLLFAEDAEYEFAKGLLPEEIEKGDERIRTLGFEVQSILVEASRRQDEWRRIRKTIETDRAILVIARRTEGEWKREEDGSISGRHRQPGSDEEAQILARWRAAHARFEANPFDGVTTVEEIVAASGVSAFAAMRVMADMKKQGLVRELLPSEIESYAIRHLQAERSRDAYKLAEWANEIESLQAVGDSLDKYLLHADTLRGQGFQTRTKSARALQMLSRLLGIGEPFRFLAREGESQVECYLSPKTLRVHLMGPRRTHSTSRYLRRRNAIKKEDLARAKKKAQRERRHLDRVLVEDGFITRDAWLRAVKDKVVSGLFSIFGWNEPYVEIQGGRVTAPPPSSINGLVCEIPLDDSLREDFKRALRRWKVLIEKIPSRDVLCLCPTQRKKGEKKRAHHLFNGLRTVGDIIQLAYVAPYELARFLFESMKSGLIRPLEDREHYEGLETALAEKHYDEAVTYCRSAMGWRYAPQLYGQRLEELRRLLADRPNMESRPVLQGESDTFGIAEVIQLLHQGKRSGTLKIRGADRELVFYLYDGDIHLLKVDEPDEDIEVWELTSSTDSSPELGKIKQRGALRESDLTDDQALGIKEDVLESFTWEEAHFEFIQNLLPTELRGADDKSTTLALNTPQLLMQAMTRMSEWDELRGLIQSPRAILKFTAGAGAEVVAASEMTDSTASLFNGRRTLEEVARLSGKRRFVVFRDAARLVRDGQLEYVGVAPKKMPLPSAHRRQSLLGGRLPQRTQAERSATHLPSLASDSDFDLPAASDSTFGASDSSFGGR